jgi:hypothetical protein
MANRLNVALLMKSLSEIMSDKYEMKITMRAVPKEDPRENSTQKAS